MALAVLLVGLLVGGGVFLAKRTESLTSSVVGEPLQAEAIDDAITAEAPKQPLAGLPVGAPSATSGSPLTCDSNFHPIGDFASAAHDWNAFLDDLSMQAPISAIGAINGYVEEHGLPLRASTNPGAIVFLKTLAAASGVSTDFVVEVNPKRPSQELRRWPVEFEAGPEAVAGNHLVYRHAATSICRPVQQSRSFAAWISINSDGTYRLLEPTEDREVPPADEKVKLMKTCPKPKSMENSDYVVCAEFRDRVTQKKRVLVWNAAQ